MDKDKMMELWHKEFEKSYYQWNLTPQVYKYLEEETDQLTGMLSGKKYYASYESWIVKELDGENAELARRMLIVISKIRNNGLIASPYNVEEEADIAIRIGYDFESLIKETIHKHRDISGKRLYWLAGRLLDSFPKEGQDFADRLLGKKLDEMVEKRKSNRELYMAMYMAVQLMNRDLQKYNHFLPVLISLSERTGGEYILTMLYYSYPLSTNLKNILVKQIQQNTSVARQLLAFVPEKEYISFLKKIETTLWPYYYLVITESVRDVNKSAILKKLYKEDRETFRDLYNRLVMGSNVQDLIYVPLLLGIMLSNGDGKEELENSGIALIASFKRLLGEYADYKEAFPDILDEQTPLENTNKIRFSRSIHWGAAIDIVEGLGVLYDYSSRARRFIHFLLMNYDRTPYPTYGSDSKSYLVAYYILGRKKWLGKDPHESLMKLINDDCNFDMQEAFKMYCALYVTEDELQNAITEAVTSEFILANQQAALNALSDGLLSIDETLVWLDLLYGTFKLTEYTPLINLLSNKSKLIRKKTEELIYNNEEGIRGLLEQKKPTMKGDALAITKRLIKRWDNERKFGADFSFTDNQTVTEFCTDNYDNDNQKFISWIPEDIYLDVRFVDLTEKVPAVVIKYILSEYMSLEEPYKIKICDKVVERLNPQDFQAVLENIYQLWKDSGAEAKKKMIMVPYCIYGSDSQIIRLKTQLKDWAEASRGALAAFVVNAIAMNGGSVALMMIDGISVKFPNNQVKNAAKAAFSFAAKALEIPEDELSDKIVPNLGFNKDGEKELDYGPRSFKVILMPDFSLSIYDAEKQKAIKSLPAPGTNDDTVKATAAKKEFSELKKQIKATVQSQTNRLEKVVMNGRRWNVSAWNDLFVDNPIMHRFATGLIWGVYDRDTLLETFRYMDDGTFNTVDEDEYTLPENASVSLIHPVELSPETAAQWREQLDDYEVVQPLLQLSSPVVTLPEKDLNGKKIIRYSATIVQSGKIAGMAKKYNMVRGDIWDGGSYTCFNWVDKYLNVAAQINFEYMYMGQEYNEEVTLGDVLFYRLGEDQETNDDPKDNMILAPSEVPARFVNTIIGIFDQLIDTK